MKLSEDIKPSIGKSLINLCDCFPKFRPWVSGWGLRTRQEWFGRRVAEIQLPNGRSFKLVSVAENYLSFQLFWLGGQFYEPITAMVIKELVGPGDVFVDAGANIGFHSLRFLKPHPVEKRLVFKLDLEGNENAALRGACETITFRRPDIIMEVASPQEPDFAAFLRQLGYHFYSITDQGLLASAVLRPVVRERFVFLNYLLSARPAADLVALFSRIAPQVKKLNLGKTSKRANRHVVERALANSLPDKRQAL